MMLILIGAAILILCFGDPESSNGKQVRCCTRFVGKREILLLETGHFTTYHPIAQGPSDIGTIIFPKTRAKQPAQPLIFQRASYPRSVFRTT